MHYFPAPAKINRFLRIVRQEANGYHYLQTLFQFTDIVDTLGFEILPHEQVICDYHNSDITPENDLIIKAIKLLRIHTGCTLGARITLEKNIPTGAGLGGGSSNAATTLMALNQLWHLNLSNERLQKLGRQLGADVPIFIHGRSAWAEGIGDQLTTMTPATATYLLIIPPLHIKTQTIFTSPKLMRNNPKMTPDTNPPYLNDCTSAIFSHYPQMKNYITGLTALGSVPKITGTGACIYIPPPKGPQLKAVLQFAQHHALGIKPFKTLNRSPLIAALTV